MSSEISQAFERLGGDPPPGKQPFTPELMIETAERIVRDATELFIKHNAGAEQDLPPTLLIGGRAGFISVDIASELNNEASKAMFAENLRQLTHTFDHIHSTALLMPSFLTKLTSESMKAAMEGRFDNIEDPVRTEVVSVVIEIRDGLTKVGFAEVTRFKDAPPKFGTIDWTTPEQAGGQLSGFFNPPTATEH